MFKKIELILLGILLIASLFLVAPSPVLEATPAKVFPSSPGRTVNYKWYSFFDVPQDPWVWSRRLALTGTDQLISANYPVVYKWEPNPGWKYFYTSARLNVTGSELPEITIDDPEFLPHNLMGGLPAGIQGGTALITNWKLRYINQTRSTALGLATSNDGYINELTGDVEMDKNATMKILGITEANFNDFASWWTTNYATVRTNWRNWQRSEGGYKATDGRLDVRPMAEWYVDHFLNIIDRKYSDANKVILSVDWVTWSMECLLARWFRETFMPGYEFWYEDLKFNAAIGPTTTNVDLDTGVTWAAYMWSFNDTAFADPAWVFESVFGDVPTPAHEGVSPAGPWPNSPAYPYYEYDNGTRKTYFVVTPGNEWYNTNGPYDYTPAPYNLKAGETLTVDWSNVYAKGPVWAYRQLHWGVGQKPIDTMQNVSGYIRFDNASEPFPSWGQFPQMNYSPLKHTIVFTGPFNFTDLSWNNVRPEWLALTDSLHPNGLMPYGSPFLEFKIGAHGDVDYDGNVDTADLSRMQQAYGSTPSKPNWVLACDLNWEGKVDANDLIELGKHFGVTP